jgi:hypothetical protein
MSEGISSTPNKTSCILQRTGSLREKYGQSGLDYITKPPNDPAGMAYSARKFQPSDSNLANANIHARINSRHLAALSHL